MATKKVGDIASLLAQIEAFLAAHPGLTVFFQTLIAALLQALKQPTTKGATPGCCPPEVVAALQAELERGKNAAVEGACAVCCIQHILDQCCEAK